MKTILWTGAIVLIVILLSLSVNHYLTQTAAELSGQIEQVQQAIEARDWAMADASFTEADERWNQVRDIWAIIIHHQEIDELEMAFARTKRFISSKDGSLALAELETAKLLLQHVPEKEKLRLHNIM